MSTPRRGRAAGFPVRGLSRRRLGPASGGANPSGPGGGGLHILQQAEDAAADLPRGAAPARVPAAGSG